MIVGRGPHVVLARCDKRDVGVQVIGPSAGVEPGRSGDGEAGGGSWDGESGGGSGDGEAGGTKDDFARETRAFFLEMRSKVTNLTSVLMKVASEAKESQKEMTELLTDAIENLSDRLPSPRLPPSMPSIPRRNEW